MILAVHVRGDHAADRDVLCAWYHRREPTARHERIQDIGEQHTCLAGQKPRLFVELLHPIHLQHRNRQIRIQCRVTVGMTIATGDQSGAPLD